MEGQHSRIPVYDPQRGPEHSRVRRDAVRVATTGMTQVRLSTIEIRDLAETIGKVAAANSKQ